MDIKERQAIAPLLHSVYDFIELKKINIKKLHINGLKFPCHYIVVVVVVVEGKN